MFFEVGNMVSGGDIIGVVYENEIFSDHKILVPPNVSGTIKSITKDGTYTIEVRTICTKWCNLLQH